MKEENVYDRMNESNEEKIDFQEILFKYIIHWPWFLGTVIICLVGAWFYLRTSTPIYNISATVLIKDSQKNSGQGVTTGLEGLGLDGIITSSQNIDNEMEVLRSKTLAKEVVEQLNLYVFYKDEDEFPARELYKTSPVVVSMTPQEAGNLTVPMVVKMELQLNGSLNVNVKVGKTEYQKFFNKLPAVFPTNEGTLAFFYSSDSTSVRQRMEGGVI